MQAEGHVARLRRDAERQKLFDSGNVKSTMTNTSTATRTRSSGQWEALFAGLEAAADDGTTLLALEPGTNEISLRGEAKDFAATTKYIQRLSRVTILEDVRMIEYEIARDHPRHPIRFSVQAKWKETPR